MSRRLEEHSVGCTLNLFVLSFKKCLTALTDLYTRKDNPLLILEPQQLSHLSELFNPKADILLKDVLSTAQDVWELFRSLTLKMTLEQRLFIVHTNYLWRPLISLWRFITRKPETPSWFSPSDIENLLRLNGFDLVSRDQALLLPIYIPGLHWLFNGVLAKLPGLQWLNLLHFYIVRKNPNFNAQNAEAVPYKVSFIIPTKDERGNIRPLFNELPKLGRTTELVFVDGASKDGTQEEIRTCQKEYGDRFEVQLHQQAVLDGKGSAVRQGFDAATGDLLFILDSDITVSPADMPKFVLALTEGQADFVMGSRLVYPMENEAMRTLNNIANKLFSMAFSWLLNRPIKDTLCGTKGLHRKYYDWIRDGRSYFGNFDPFGDFDLIFGAARANLKIVEIPIRYRNRTYGEIKISRFTHGWLLLKMTWIAAKKLKFH